MSADLTWSQHCQEWCTPGKPCSTKKALASTTFRGHTPSTTQLWAHTVNTQGSGSFLQGLIRSQVLIHFQTEKGAAGDTAPGLWSLIQYRVRVAPGWASGGPQQGGLAGSWPLTQQEGSVLKPYNGSTSHTHLARCRLDSLTWLKPIHWVLLWIFP